MKIVVIIAVVAAVLLGVFWFQQHRATEAANNGDLTSPDNSVTATSLAATPDPAPAPAPAKKAMPGSTTVSSAPAVVTQTSLQPDTTTSSAPASDSIDRTPPNGMVFAGTGHMQVYRQGNITWRLNTDTGEACVLFATDREWRKPRVYNAGCRKS